MELNLTFELKDAHIVEAIRIEENRLGPKKIKFWASPCLAKLSLTSDGNIKAGIPIIYQVNRAYYRAATLETFFLLPEQEDSRLDSIRLRGVRKTKRVEAFLTSKDRELATLVKQISSNEIQPKTATPDPSKYFRSVGQMAAELKSHIDQAFIVASAETEAWGEFEMQLAWELPSIKLGMQFRLPLDPIKESVKLVKTANRAFKDLLKDLKPVADKVETYLDLEMLPDEEETSFLISIVPKGLNWYAVIRKPSWNEVLVRYRKALPVIIEVCSRKKRASALQGVVEFNLDTNNGLEGLKKLIS